MLGAGTLIGTLKHLEPGDQAQLTIETMSTEALTTSAIEGEILNRASVQSSIRQQLGLSSNHRRIQPAEQGIAEMMVILHRSWKTPFSHEMLFTWHRMLMNGRRDLKNVGAYRTHHEPMQVVSGSMDSPHVHFQAPPSLQVTKEMTQFIHWLNHTAPHEKEPLPALTRAGIAHLYFVSIHPFKDGNGRIGRAIAEKSMAQSLGQPTLTALAATILTKRKSYYQALELANKQNEITLWLRWFAATAIEAQQRIITIVEFLIAKTKLLDRLRGQLNDRQEKALLRVLREGPDGFTGGLSASKYIHITQASAATATRDLMDMVAKKALVRTGERRHARYHVGIPLHRLPSITIDDHGNIIESRSTQVELKALTRSHR